MLAVIVENEVTGEVGLVNNTFYDDVDTANAIAAMVNAQTPPEISAWIRDCTVTPNKDGAPQTCSTKPSLPALLE
jgi:hypothetical protein